MRRTLSVSIVLSGFTAVLMQALLLREFLATFSGNELSLGLVLMSWLIYLAAGADMFARLAPRLRDTPGALVLTQVVAGLCCPVAMYLARMVGGLMPTNDPYLRDLLILPALALAPLCLALGAQFAVACGLAHAGGHRHPPAAVAARQALGGVAAGLLYTLVVADNVNPMLAAFALAGLTLLCAAWVALASQPRGGMAAMLLVGVALGGFSALLTVPATQKLCANWPGRIWRQTEDSGRFLSSGQTWYTRHGLLTYEDAGLQPTGVEPPQGPPPPGAMSMGEGRVCVPLVMHAAPRTVLLIAAPWNYLIAGALDCGVQRLDVVAPDPQAAAIIRAHHPPAEVRGMADQRVRFIQQPARAFIGSAGADYDAVLVLGPAPLTADANRLYTREFFLDVRHVLRPGGIIGLHLPPAGDGESRNPTPSIYRTLSEVFTNAVAVRSLAGYHLVAADTPAALTDGPAVIFSRLERILPGARLLAAAPREDAARRWAEQAEQRFRTSVAAAETNTDLRPVTRTYHFIAFDTSGTGSPPNPVHFIALPPHTALLLFMLIPICLLALQWRRSPRIAFTGWAMFCAGFVTISVLLTAFLAAQSQTGEIAYLSGAFLAALALGTGLGAVWGARAQAEAQALVDLRRAQLSLLMLCLIAPVAVTAIPTLPGVMLPLLALLLVGTGFLAGAIYPLAAGIYGDPMYGATSLHALGLLGGAGAGALLCIFIIPAAGIPTAMMAASAVAAFGMFGVPIVRALLR